MRHHAPFVFMFKRGRDSAIVVRCMQVHAGASTHFPLAACVAPWEQPRREHHRGILRWAPRTELVAIAFIVVVATEPTNIHQPIIFPSNEGNGNHMLRSLEMYSQDSQVPFGSSA